MTLTSNISIKSLVWKAILEEAPILSGNEAKKELVFSDISKLNLFIQPGANTSLVGTAFDLLVRRIISGEWDKLALRGLSYSIPFGNEENLTKLYALARKTDELELASIIMALFVIVVRAGPIVFESDNYKPFYGGKTLEEALSVIDSRDLQDLLKLQEVSEFTLRNYSRAENFISGPNFVGSSLVEGADADFIVDGTLVELKTTGAKLAPYKVKDYLAQSIAYSLLDFDDKYKIESIDLWLPRYSYHLKISLESILDKSLPEARASFKSNLLKRRARIDENLKIIEAHMLNGQIPEKSLKKWGFFDLPKTSRYERLLEGSRLEILNVS